MKSIRLFERHRLSLSFLPTHLAIGLSLHSLKVPHTVKNPWGRQPTLKKVHFIHLHVPFFYVTFSWTSPV